VTNLIVVIIVGYHKILSYILISGLGPYIGEINGDQHCELQRNRLTTDQIFYIRLILEKKWESNETVHHIFIDFRKASESVRSEVLYNIVTEFGIPMKLVRLINMCSNEMYNEVSICLIVFLFKMV
jgi:hypothetical protein